MYLGAAEEEAEDEEEIIGVSQKEKTHYTGRSKRQLTSIHAVFDRQNTEHAGLSILALMR